MKTFSLKNTLVLLFLFIIISCKKRDERKGIEGYWKIETIQNLPLNFSDEIESYENNPCLGGGNSSGISMSFQKKSNINARKGDGSISAQYEYLSSCGIGPPGSVTPGPSQHYFDQFTYKFNKNTISIDFYNNVFFDDIENAYFKQFINKIYIEVSPDKYIILVQ